MPCTGNTTEACGGPNRLNLFWSGTTGPQTNPGPGLWNFVGCYAEGTTGRALPNGVGTTGGSAALTVSLCTSACQTAGYVLAGVEYSGECYCANTVQNGGILAPDGLTGCNMLCNGNKSEFCGGGGRLNLYDYNHAVTLPPYTTISTTSSTSTSISIAASSSSSTSSSHSTTCTSSHGSSTSSSTSSHSTTCTSSHANSVLSSSSSSSSLDPVSSSSTSSSKPASSSTSSSASAVPTLSHKTTIGAYTLMGCYSEATTGRALTGKSFYDYPTMTLEECSTQCSGFTYFGVEYGGECKLSSRYIH
jgi:WSC domain